MEKTWKLRLAGMAYRFWARTLRIRAEPLPPAPAVLVLWHRNLFVPLWAYRHRGIVILASRHRDGRRIAEIARGLGYEPVLGSSTRGGAAGARGLLRALQAGRWVALTPDGPRGPRFVVKPGALAIARHTGAPIYTTGVACSPVRVLGSWDRFLLPWPFARCTVVFQGPYRAEDLDPDRLARHLHRADQEARRRLQTP